MINAQVADAFDRIADLMEIIGGDHFRINSYRRAVRVIKSHTEDIAEAAANQTLTDLPGIGKGIALALGDAGATVYVTGRTIKEG
ncbi:MAG: hypothetical protein IID39_09460, partial [Planctomycetes bacterium]|nr:hypothetical protein [Planctomycetota bacterium]